MLVLVITGIIFSVTMNFSWDQVWWVQIKQQKSEFVDTYNRIYQNNLRTKRYSWYIYSGMQITFQSWKNTRDTNYYPIIKDEDKIFNITNKLKNWQIGLYSWHSQLNIQFNPLLTQCQLSFLDNTTEKTQKKAFFSIIYSTKKYCFSLQTPLCQLQEISCEWLWSK